MSTVFLSDKVGAEVPSLTTDKVQQGGRLVIVTCDVVSFLLVQPVRGWT